MPFILRVDVDKPYGRNNFINKIKSKLAEDYWFPYANNYLHHLKDFLQFCNIQGISGNIYFRNCTTPDEETKKLLVKGKHRAGFHAENTRSFDTFNHELNSIKIRSGLKIDSFTKHGSGMLKLGKNHYPLYEPDKYLAWAEKTDLRFPFGNGICKKKEDLLPKNGFFPNMFWIERDYRDKNFFDLDMIVHHAINLTIPVLIHPCNYSASEIVKNDFKELTEIAKKKNVPWIL